MTVPSDDDPHAPPRGDPPGADDDVPVAEPLSEFDDADEMPTLADSVMAPGPPPPPVRSDDRTTSTLSAASPSSWPVGPGGRPAEGPKYAHATEIGRGGMGAIYKVKDQALHRELAMKVLLHQKATDPRPKASASGEPDLLQRFLEEAQVTAQLDHPGVVAVHDLGVDAAGHPFFTMSLVRGETLSVVFHNARKGREGWTRTKALQALHKVCETMAFAHSKGVIHRDLKPANVMVGKFGEVYVMDWGLAKVRGKGGGAAGRPDTAELHTLRSEENTGDSVLETMAGRVVGTPAYMPPEQAHGRLDEVDARSDVYSLGAMLYQLLSGHPPYMPPGKDVTAAKLLLRVMEEPPEPLSQTAADAPAELVSICEKAMARDRAARYADAADLADDLNRFLTGHVVRAYKTGALIELRKWIERNKAVSATAAVAALVLVVVTVAFLVSLQNERDEVAKQRDEAGRQRDEAARQRDEAGRQRDRAKKAEKIANERAEEAERARKEERQALERVYRLSDSKRLADLQARAETLWPVHPDTVPRLDTWIAAARELEAVLEDHRATLAELEQRAAAGGAADDPSGREPLAWQVSVLAELIDGIEQLVEKDKGLLPRAIARREKAASLRRRTLGDAAAAWEDAITAIADKRRHPLYGGRIITPQLGLVPLGPDPDSGLWEFAHVDSGTVPTRDPATGRLVLEDKSAIVLVLVPGGPFWMGAQSGAEGGSNYDPQARDDEGPVHEVTLAPYFLSKYECTQAQWWTLTGGQVPSTYRAGARAAGEEITWRNPVELVTWEECDRWLGRHNLVLPTEAQWERACRAGTQTRWSGVDVPAELRANVADSHLRDNGGPPEWPYTVEIDDGHVVHAPVGTYPANGWGFHDLHGNVWEWCRDGYGPYGSLPETDPLLHRDAEDRVKRGGAWDSTALLARSALRYHLEPNVRTQAVGLRAARPLDQE